MRESGEAVATEMGPQKERGTGGAGAKEARLVKWRPKAGLGLTAEASPALAPVAIEKSGEELKTIGRSDNAQRRVGGLDQSGIGA